jgi:hypothetical protein
LFTRSDPRRLIDCWSTVLRLFALTAVWNQLQ